MDRVHGPGLWVHDIVDHSRSLIIRSVARISLKLKGIGDLISDVDQGMDGWGGASEVAAQRAAEPLSRGDGSLEPGIAHATGHHFQCGLTLQMRHSEVNSPRGSSSGLGAE
jgi:hypothetical protein